MSRFIIVIPTIRQERPRFAEGMERIKASFTLPTELHVLDGKDGKVPTLNRALDSLLPAEDDAIYVTMDDDLWPEPGWQDAVVRAFLADPQLGVVCPWLGDSPEMAAYMGPDSLHPWTEVSGVRLRYLRPMRHIPGALLAFRASCARQVGPQPETGLKYDIFEDAWRGRRAHKLGWKAAYVESPPITMIAFEDDETYLAQKAADIQSGRAIQESVLADAGLQDPLSWRVRRLIARLRGRAKD